MLQIQHRWLLLLAGVFLNFGSIARAQETVKPVEAKDRAERARPYVEAGMPSPDKVWNAQDYENALKVITRIKQDKTLPLPRLLDDPSGGMFARLIQPENLSTLKDRHLPIDVRMEEGFATLSSLGALLRIYDQPNDAGHQPFGDEILELLAFNLILSEPIIEMTNAFFEKLPEAERRDPVRLKGFEQMRKGAAGSVQATLLVLEETKTYRMESLIGLSERLPDLIPPLWGFLGSVDRFQLRVRMIRVSNDHPEAKIRQSLKRLTRALSSEAKTADDEPKKTIPPKD